MMRKEGHHLFRSGVACEIIIVILNSNQPVAHGPSDQIQPVAVVMEYFSEFLYVCIKREGLSHKSDVSTTQDKRK